MFELLSIFIPFLIVHTIFDFYLQPLSWVESKKAQTYRSSKLYFHSALHAVALIVPALLLSIDTRLIVYLVITVAITHFIIDLWKVTTKHRDKLSSFVIDQILHISVLLLLSWCIAEGSPWTDLMEYKRLNYLITIFFGYMLILKPTSIFIDIFLKRYPITRKSSPVNDKVEQAEAYNGLASAGTWIGYLERTLILTFTLVGSYAAIGFVLAAKSIFRFGELSRSEDRSMTEYVLLGSLLSVVITTMVGVGITLIFK